MESVNKLRHPSTVSSIDIDSKINGTNNSLYTNNDWNSSSIQNEESSEHSNNNDFNTKNSPPSIENNSYFLWILTPVAASFSVIIVIAALAGPIWLITEEKLITSNFKIGVETSTMSKCTKSSLWIICSAILTNSTNCTVQSIQEGDNYSCAKIDYFPKEEYRADAQDSTSAIPYTIIKSCPFFLASGIVLIISFIIYLIPTILHQHDLYYFTAGILFVVSGLLMLIGLIVYISVFKSEIGSKLRSKSAFEPPIFKFAYGQSFYLYVFGFISTEFVGVLNIFLYISILQLKNSKKKLPCLPFLTFNRKKKRPLKTCQKLDPQFICKKHAIPINLLFDRESGKRYYFERLKKFDENSENLAKSLNELYTEPAPTFSNFDMPHYNRAPLTRSVSTTTDIYLNGNNKKGCRKIRRTLVDTKENTNDMCGFSKDISQGLRKTKNDIVNEFFKRTGVKPKAKNIYYIENPDEHSDENVFVLNNYTKNNKTNTNRHSFKEIPRIGSHASLRNQYDKYHTKSLVSLNGRDTTDLNKYGDYYISKSAFHNDALYQSRTLPRSFMKRNCDVIDNFPYQLQNSSQYLQQSKRNFNTSNSQFYTSTDNAEALQCNQRNNNNNGLTIQWPQAIPTSPSYSIKSSNMYNRIPSRSEKIYPSMNPNIIESNTLTHFPNHFDNQNYHITNFRKNESFDLDQIEKDCRLSHASLFNETNYDMINGTAV